MNLLRVHSSTERKTFIDLPYAFYRHDPLWVAPLRSELRGQFNPKTNPFLEHVEYDLFLLKENDAVIGRIAAFIDHTAVTFWDEPIGMFGYFECIDDDAAAAMLLEAAASWLQDRKMTAMRGPWSFVSEEWGLVVEGFSPPPCIMAPYNPPYYDKLMSTAGLEKVKDLLCYYIAAAEGYTIPTRILTLTDRVAERYGVTVRPVSMKRYADEAQIILDLSNRSIIHNWGYTPVSKAEAEAMARDLKMILQPGGALIAENCHGEPIGFALALPDINVLLKGLNGRMVPFGWMKLLYGLPRLRSYRMFGLGVVPEYHGLGIDSLLYRALYESLFTDDLWMEINYVLEDNAAMNNAIRKLNAKPLRRYRIYQKNL